MLVSAKDMLTQSQSRQLCGWSVQYQQFGMDQSGFANRAGMQFSRSSSVFPKAPENTWAGYKTVVGMVNGMLEELNITVPVALHLDHGSYEGAKKCIEAGFSSIMFDGSHYPIEENIEKTKELVAICNDKGLSLEAEVGSIGGEEDGVIGSGRSGRS